MSDFEKLVVDCRKNKINREISNSAWSHALILAENLFKAAIDNKEDVRIVTGSLNHKFYDKLIHLMEKCLDKQKVELIVLDPESNLDNNEFAQLIDESELGSVIKAGDDSNMKRNHFIIIGNNGYRLELDHEQTTAQANFNNPLLGEFLKNFFNQIKDDIITKKELAGNGTSITATG